MKQLDILMQLVTSIPLRMALTFSALWPLSAVAEAQIHTVDTGKTVTIPESTVAQSDIRVAADGLGAALLGTAYTTPQIANGITRSLNGDTITTSGTSNAASALQAIGANGVFTGTDLTLNTSGNSNVYGAWANNGGTINLTDSHIQTAGTNGHAVYVANGSTAVLNGVDIATNGSNGAGLYATDAGSQLAATNTNITTSGSTSHGVWIKNSASVNFTGGSINASGYGIHAEGGSSFMGTGITIVSAGSRGIEALSRGTIRFENGSVTSALYSLYADGAGSDISVINSSIFGQSKINSGANMQMDNTNITFEQGTGVYVDNNSSFVGDKVRITTHGSDSFGIQGQNSLAQNNSRITLTNSTIDATAENSHGVWLSGSTFTGDRDTINGGLRGITIYLGSTATLSNSSINTYNDGSRGVYVAGANNRFSGNNVQITSNGAGAAALHVEGGTATLTDVTLNAPSGTGLYMNASSPVLTMANGSVDGALGIYVSAGNATLTFDKVSIAGNNGTLMDVVGSGKATFSASNGSILNGDIQAATRNNATVTLTSDVGWTGAARNIGALSLSGNSRWTITGNSDVASLNLDNSAVMFSALTGDPAVSSNYKTLVVRGNYTGTAGIVQLNTFLSDDSSPTDKLIVQGDTAGSSLLQIVGTGGLGALTVGDGIEVVHVDGASSGTFTLSGRVAAGLTEYVLYQGGLANPNDGNWYLRNTIIVPPPGPTPNPVDPIDPGNPGGGIPVPNVRPEVPLATAIPPLATEYGYFMLDTLHDRIGNISPSPAAPVYEDREVWCKNPGKNFRCIVRMPVSPRQAVQERDAWFAGSWGRVLGERGFHDKNYTAVDFFRHGPRYDYTFGGIQAGFDVWGRETVEGVLDRAGLYVGYGTITSNIKGAYAGLAGNVDMNAYTLGGYWTHKGASGWYTDTVLQGTFYSTDARSIYGEHITPDGWGLVASLEGGYAFQLGNGFSLEPQAQLAYQKVSFDRGQDTFGFFYFDESASLRGRIGARLVKDWMLGDANNAHRISTWLRANLWHEFKGDGRTVVSTLDGLNQASIPSPLGGTWGEIGVGVSGQVSKTVSLFGTASYNRSFDDRGREGWDGRLGITYKW